MTLSQEGGGVVSQLGGLYLLGGCKNITGGRVLLKAREGVAVLE